MMWKYCVATQSLSQWIKKWNFSAELACMSHTECFEIWKLFPMPAYIASNGLKLPQYHMWTQTKTGNSEMPCLYHQTPHLLCKASARTLLYQRHFPCSMHSCADFQNEWLSITIPNTPPFRLNLAVCTLLPNIATGLFAGCFCDRAAPITIRQESTINSCTIKIRCKDINKINKTK